MRITLVRLAMGFGLSLGLAAPAWAQATRSTTTTTTPKRAAAKVDLNTASVAELEELPGVGPGRAAEIVKARPFRSVNELKALRGFSAPVMAELTPHVTVSDVTTTKTTTKPSTTAKGTAPHLVGKVDLNTASVAELEELPGVGPGRAAEIVKARPFKSVNELKALRGFSAPVMAELTPHVTVSEPRVMTKPSTTKDTMPKTATKTTTKKAGSPALTAREAAREDDLQHLARKKASLAGRTINLNTATAEELQELPGIGPVRAAAIIKDRPFQTKEDIMKVEGIKEGVFGHVKDYISVK